MKNFLAFVFLTASVESCTRTCKVDWQGELMIAPLIYVSIPRCGNPLEIFQDLDSGYNYPDANILRIKANDKKYHLKKGQPSIIEDYRLTFTRDTMLKEQNLIYDFRSVIYAEPVK